MSNSVSKIPLISQDMSLSLAIDTINMDKQALIFVNSKRSAESVAEKIARKQKKLSACEDLSLSALNALSSPTKQCKRLAYCLERGIAFHHAGLASKQRELVEDFFRSNLIKIIVSTPTLAAGLDMPAFRTIIRDLKRFTNRGLQFIPVLEYEQMAGRAGRPGMEKYGEAICVAGEIDAKEEILEKYIRGVPENLYSKLAVEPVLRTYILSLVASGFIKTKSELFDFFSKTFYAHQFGDLHALNKIIDKMVNLLSSWQFLIVSKDKKEYSDIENLKYDFSKHQKTKVGEIESKKSVFVSAYEYLGMNDEGDAKELYLYTTVVGKRVSEIYLDPYTANFFLEKMFKVKRNKLHKPFSLLQIITNSLELRPLLSLKAGEQEYYENLLLKFDNQLVIEEPSFYEIEYESFYNSIKTTFLFYDWIDELTEDTILEKYGVRPGELAVKLDRADWLLYSLEELTRSTGLMDELKHITRLRVRVKEGVREELLSLLKLKGIGRVRARKLYMNGVKDVKNVVDADVSNLVLLIGPALTKSIKEQVGITVDPEKVKIKTKKRVGQKSLIDY